MTQTPDNLQVAAAVVFLDEAEHLPRLLASIARQTRPPDRLLLVDDGSRDASPALAEAFAREHPYARVLRRPQREKAQDRLAAAAELRAFQWAVDAQDEPWDVIAKLDGDLELPARFFEAIAAAFAADPALGMAGAPLRLEDDEPLHRERTVPWHVRGATKFYRRACWEQIAPLPAILGWDTIDEARARMHGWRVRVVEVPGGEVLHLRVTGTYDGAVRGFRRRGVAAWGYGAHPLHVLASAAARVGDRPRVVGAAAYLDGYLRAAARREPRAEPALVRFVRGEQTARLRRVLTAGSRP